MRIISGKLGGRRFNPPVNKWPTRPTTDYAKEALFNILQNMVDFRSIKVLDLFGGTGSLTFEFVSRGCDDVTYVEKFPSCLKYVKKVSEEFKVIDNISIIRSDVFKYIASCREKYDLIFADPPYALPTLASLPEKVFGTEILSENGILILEHDQKHSFGKHSFFKETRSYGGVYFSFFSRSNL